MQHNAVQMDRVQQETPKAGILEVVCGPMFAGKTAFLMRHIVEQQQLGKVVCVLQPAHDTRSGNGSIRAHNGKKMPAQTVEAAEHVVALAANASVVVIDEAHFLGGQLVEPCRELLKRGYRVMVAGIDTDHLGDAFEPFPALCSMAHAVHRLHGVCTQCGSPSTHTARLVQSEDRFLVGGAESYEPRCGSCFKRVPQ